MNAAKDILVNSKLIKEIVKSYTPLDYTPKLKELLSSIYPAKNLDNFCKLDLHKKINDLIIDSYEGEQVLKYRLFKAFQHEKLVAAYEIKVKNSRVDFLTINGHTTSFEIKSNLDNLDKLAKQSDDYITAFEFNNIVIHERHLNRCINIIPNSVGIITVDRKEHQIIRKPVFNRNLHARTQLELLSKRELGKYYGSTDTSDILERFEPAAINDLFKLALKDRYRIRWNFIVENADDILPIDLQFFFNKTIKPDYIYS